MARIDQESDVLHVGDRKFTLESLHAWNAWDHVRDACLALDPQPTFEEMEVLRRTSELCGSGGGNGFMELQQVLARTHRVKKEKPSS